MLGNLFSKMTTLKEWKTKRISSWDRTGDNADRIAIQPGEKGILAEIEGTGCINHIHLIMFCPDRHQWRKALLRMYWDGEDEPSVNVPVGDFFGIGHCRVRHFKSLLLCVNTGYTPGLNSYFPMPFSDTVKIEVANESDEQIPALYYHIDYEERETLEKDLGRFHAQWRRENPCTAVGSIVDEEGFDVRYGGQQNLTGNDNYVILEAEGKGNYAGYMLGVDNLVGGWWGEGDDMIFIDGEEWPPSIHGTGTEEIFGGGACPAREYAGPYTGFHLISPSDWSGKISMYRFYVNDPVRFSKSIKVTIEHGHANNLSNDYSSVAYWYQTEPHMQFPDMPPSEDRVPREPNEYWDLVLSREKEMWKIFLEQTPATRWRKYSLEDAWKVRSLISDIDNCYAESDYMSMSKLVDTVIDIMKKYG